MNWLNILMTHIGGIQVASGQLGEPVFNAACACEFCTSKKEQLAAVIQDNRIDPGATGGFVFDPPQPPQPEPKKPETWRDRPPLL